MTRPVPDESDGDGPACKFILAIDQGTTSTRAILFNHDGQVHSVGQKEHAQITPNPGWVEHDANEVWRNVREVVGLAMSRGDTNRHSISAVGISNQRETTVVWEKATGIPIYNAIVWQDTRTQGIVNEVSKSGGIDKFKERVGLPIATYFSGPKIKWLLDNVSGARQKAERGELLFGTMDTWLVWNMTGGCEGGRHVTDVTNASRTLLMNIDTLTWNPNICAELNIPMNMLPEIKSCSEIYGHGRHRGLLPTIPIAGIMGDQQAATFGQVCFQVGQAKTTYGTGNFMLMNTGREIVRSNHGLLTTVAYKIGTKPPVYALEGSVAVTGSLIQWLRDKMELIPSSPDIEKLAGSVADSGGCYFVPAFSGLFAPYWRADARGAVVGLSFYNTKAHFARAALESTAYQTMDIVNAMNADSGVALKELKVDGGMTANELLMQFQADILDCIVVRSKIVETTALGAAYAAGLAVGFWRDLDELTLKWHAGKKWTPAMSPEIRTMRAAGWKKAITKSLGWEGDKIEGADEDIDLSLPTSSKRVQTPPKGDGSSFLFAACSGATTATP